ncbi:hypothetical protein C366_04063 [Cryptococcus neoformans Tu401-1]|nr:hypothetical protein C366_04063 [Cryptococcus neoformans var. grubii Tu401-1]OXM78110.1 hypothetical protein C364_04046 [Cryptococcus neoformans var. grubii Bt63]
MRFTSFLIAALPFVGSAFAAPLNNKASDALVARSESLAPRTVDYVGILTTLDNDIKNAGPLSGDSTEGEVTAVLTAVKEAFDTAKSALHIGSSKRDVDTDVVARDNTANEVSTLLSTVSADVKGLIAPVDVTLLSLPAIGGLVKEVNSALDSVLVGLGDVLGGVVALVAKTLNSLGIDIAPFLSKDINILYDIFGKL